MLEEASLPNRSPRVSSASTTARRAVMFKEVPLSNASISCRDGRRSDPGRGICWQTSEPTAIAVYAFCRGATQHLTQSAPRYKAAL